MTRPSNPPPYGGGKATVKPRVVAALLVVLWGNWITDVAASRFIGRTTRFLLASFPKLKQVNYAVLPNPTWRPLILRGLSRPEAICVDPENRRLFVADGFEGTVLWYQLKVLPPGRLMTDGRKHTIMQAVVARGIAVDTLGSLYVAGRHDPLPPTPPSEAVFKVDAQAVAMAIAGAPPPAAATELWNRENTGMPGGATEPQLFEPAGLAVDPFHIFWGNLVRGDQESASVVKASTTVPTFEPERSLRPLADNTDGVTCLVLTPTNVYYAASGNVFGVPKGKETASCGVDGVLCPVVSYQEAGETLEPTSMVWDGDGTIYMADLASNAIYSFAAGTLSQHILTKVADGRGVWGLAIYSDMSGAARCSKRALSVMVAWVVAVCGVCHSF